MSYKPGIMKRLGAVWRAVNKWIRSASVQSAGKVNGQFGDLAISNDRCHTRIDIGISSRVLTRKHCYAV